MYKDYTIVTLFFLSILLVLIYLIGKTPKVGSIILKDNQKSERVYPQFEQEILKDLEFEIKNNKN